MCARVRTCVCACINNEISHFSGFSLSHYVHKSYIGTRSSDSFSMWDYFYVFMCASDVTLCGVSDRTM